MRKGNNLRMPKHPFCLFVACCNAFLPHTAAYLNHPWAYVVCRIGRDIAKGLFHIHPTIVHRDLKPANVLLDHKGASCESHTIVPTLHVNVATTTVLMSTNASSLHTAGVAKISDFGMARFKLHTHLQSTKNADAGTMAYMAPECHDNQTVTHKAVREAATASSCLTAVSCTPPGKAANAVFYASAHCIATHTHTHTHTHAHTHTHTHYAFRMVAYAGCVQLGNDHVGDAMRAAAMVWHDERADFVCRHRQPAAS